MSYEFNVFTGTLDKVNSGDITSVGNVTSGAAFDGTQDGWLLTFLRSGETGTLEWNGTDSYFRFNNPGTNSVTMVAGNPSTELFSILSLFNSLDITSAGYASDNNGIVFAESRTDLLQQGSIFAGLFNDGADPVAGDRFVTFSGGAYSSVGGGTLPTTAHMQIRTAANWSGTSTPGEIAFATMDIGEVDPLAPSDRIIIRSDGTMDFIGDPANPIGKLTWDNSDNGYAVPKNLLSLQASSDGTSFVVGVPSSPLSGFLDIFTTIGEVAVEGVSGDLGVLLCESKTGLADLGALLLTGAYTDTGLAPDTGQSIFNNIVFGGDGSGAVLTVSAMQVLAAEDWSAGGSGTLTIFNVGETGTNNSVNALILSGTFGTIFNADNATFLDFLIKGAGGDMFFFDASADTLNIAANTTFTKPVVITQATGTAPLTITSTTKTTNLNVDRVDDLHVATSGSALPNMAATNSWTNQQYYPIQTLTLSAGTFTWNWDTQRMSQITGSGGSTIACPVPSNIQPGTAILIVNQTATGGNKLTFASATFKQGASLAGLVGNANGWIRYTFTSNGTIIYVEGADYT